MIDPEIYRQFQELDIKINRLVRDRNSASPTKKGSSLLTNIIEELKLDDSQNTSIESLYIIMEGVVDSILENYPENIFWDLDFLASNMFTKIQEEETNTSKSKRAFYLREKLQDIFELFGNKTAIHFRYIHDFIYGYDWCKWVRSSEDPIMDHLLDPFGNCFLDSIKKRGLEILELIAKNDENYVSLDSGVYRNPFTFSRGTEDEIRLFRDLANTGDIPVPGWQVYGAVQFKKDYSLIRNNRAVTLGIHSNDLPGAHKI
jgi:hypothetical protein